MGDDLTHIVRRKIQDIQKLIKNADKDLPLRKGLDSQLTEILTEGHKVGHSEKLPPVTLLPRLLHFRKHILKKLSGSSVIRSPTVSLEQLGPDEIQMSLGRKQLSSIENGGRVSADSSSDDDDLFELKLVRKNSITSKSRNRFGISDLPEKRVRKQVIRPDFVSCFKKFKMEREREDGRSSSNDGDSPPPTSNGLSVEFPCPVCRKIFRKKGHMTRHLLTHEPEKPYGCDFCPKRFAAKYSLQMHLLNRHNTDAKPFECDHQSCDKRFTLKKELDQHKLSHKDGFKPRNYPCHLCELKFINKDDLDTHLETHPEANIYHCGHCDKSFPRKYNLTRHERTHSTEKPYKCYVCNKDFGTKNGLHMHLQAHETDENKPLSCHLCNKRFTVEQNLELHILYHNQSDEKPFPCELCEVRFKTQERLEKHFETHGSIEGRVYPCQYCEKQFPRKYNLVRHELSHTHGRRKPKDGLPIVRHDYRHDLDDDGSDEENCSMVSGTYSETLRNGFEPNNRYSYSFETISKSELYTTFFGEGDGFFTESDDPTPPFSTESYSVVKFENY